MADYIIVSTAVVDSITTADGTLIENRPGGAGIYAAGGALLWSRSVTQCTGVGADFPFMSWYSGNGASTEGLSVRDEHTPVNRICYFDDGEREEKAVYGPDHYRKMEATPADIAAVAPGAKGIYIFKEAIPEYWDAVIETKEKYGLKVLWEINADSAVPEQLETVKSIACRCDVFSINRTEAMRMLGADSAENAAEILKDWGIPLVFLRTGSKGAIMISDGKTCNAPSVPDAVVEDPTGGGNSSSAAVLCGWCEGRSPLQCGVMGSISAAAAIRQYGPPVYDKNDYKWAENLLKTMTCESEM